MQLIVWAILFVMGVIHHLNPKDTKGFLQQIKYDLRDKKILFIVALSVTGVLVLSVIGVTLASYDIVDTLVGDVCVVILLGWPIVVVFWADYLNCVFYLRRLRRNGYELPVRKKDYGKRLGGLLKNNTHGKRTESVTWDSIVLATISWVVAAGLLVRAIAFWWEYQEVQDIIVFCMVVLGVIIMSWIVVGICYWIQRTNSKYRDDVAFEENRKIRVHFTAGLYFIIFMASLCNIGVFLMDQGVRYAISSREQSYWEEQHYQEEQLGDGYNGENY